MSKQKNTKKKRKRKKEHKIYIRAKLITFTKKFASLFSSVSLYDNLLPIDTRQLLQTKNCRLKYSALSDN